MKKNLLILGNKGRVGSALEREALSNTMFDDVIGVDISGNWDMAYENDWHEALKHFTPYAIVNCTYPKDYLDHIIVAQYSIDIGAKWMAEREGHDVFDGGKIINISSIYGMRAQDPRLIRWTNIERTPLLYHAAKAATIAMTKAGVHYASSGVQVNCVSPGGIIAEYMGHDFVSNYCERTPALRMCDEEDVVNAIMFLLDKKSNYITGQNIVVDGGFTAW